MALVSFDELASAIRAYPGGFVCGTGASLQEVEELSSNLGLEIRGTFKDFLQTFGWLEIAYDDVWGLGGDCPVHLRLEGLTQSERTEMHPSLPNHLLPFNNDGAGNLFCLDTNCNHDEPHVVLWVHEKSASQMPEPTASSFAEWLRNLIDMRSLDLA